MKTRRLIVAGLLLVAAMTWASARAAATYVPIDFSAFHNDRLQNMDERYPSGPVVLGGVPFEIPPAGLGQVNIWHSAMQGGPNPRFIDIPIGMTGVTEVHTLINTAWGEPGPNAYASITFFWGHGATTEPLVGDDDMRDWKQNVWTNHINSTTTINVVSLPPDGVYREEHRLDKQFFDVSGASAMTLVKIRIEDNGWDGPIPPAQRVFLTGLTVGVVPEPATLGLLALGGLAGVGRVRSGRAVR